jgi:hypothetical protein
MGFENRLQFQVRTAMYSALIMRTENNNVIVIENGLIRINV